MPIAISFFLLCQIKSGQLPAIKTELKLSQNLRGNRETSCDSDVDMETSLKSNGSCTYLSIYQSLTHSLSHSKHVRRQHMKCSKDFIKLHILLYSFPTYICISVDMDSFLFAKKYINIIRCFYLFRLNTRKFCLTEILILSIFFLNFCCL